MEYLELIGEHALQIICSVAVIISIIAAKKKTTKLTKEQKEKILAKLKKKEDKQVASLQKTLKKQAELDEKESQ